MIDNLNVKYNIPFLIPEQYNDAMSYQELLYAVIDKLNAVIDSVNSVPDEIATDVNKQLTEIIDSGFFDKKITDIINAQIDDINAKINENAVNIANEWKKIYPVGSYYISENSTSPSNLFGGTWEALHNKFLVAEGSSFAFGTDGGALNHKHSNQATQSGGSGNSGSTVLSIEQIPNHSHRTKVFRLGSKSADGPLLTNWSNGSSTAEIIDGTENVGGGAGHNHTIPAHTHNLNDTQNASSLPPYHPVYVWRRTA